MQTKIKKPVSVLLSLLMALSVFGGLTLTAAAKETLVVTVDPKTKVFGETDPELTYQVSGLLEGDEATVTLTRAPGENAGSYRITADVDAGENYVVSCTGADLVIEPKEITVTADTKAKTYGEADPAFTYSVTGLLGEDAMTGALTREPGNDKGTYQILLGTLTAGDNYAINYTGADFTIAEKTLDITAHNITKTYGETDPALTYTVTGLQYNDTVSGKLTRAPGEEKGTYAISLGTLTAGDNYAINFTGATFTIGAKALTVKADAKTKMYGEADPALTYTVTGLENGDALSVTLSRALGENVGAYAIAADIRVSDDYDLTYIPANLTIKKRPLTVKAWANSKTEGESDPKLDYKIEGLLEGDHIGVTLSREPGEAVGEYAINAQFTGAENYDITYVGATFRIHSTVCKLCGKEHNGNIFDKLVGFFHRIIYWFKAIFSGLAK